MCARPEAGEATACSATELAGPELEQLDGRAARAKRIRNGRAIRQRDRRDERAIDLGAEDLAAGSARAVPSGEMDEGVSVGVAEDADRHGLVRVGVGHDGPPSRGVGKEPELTILPQLDKRNMPFMGI